MHDTLQREYEHLYQAGADGGAGSKYLRFFDRYRAGDWQREVPAPLLATDLTGCVVLDYGCKFGQLTPLFRALGAAETLNVEIDEDYLRDGTRFLGERYGSTYLRSDDCYVDVASQSVDFIYAGEVISHIHPQLLYTFYEEAARVLKPGGRILIHDSNNAAHLPTRLDRLRQYGEWEAGSSTELGSNYEKQRDRLIRKSFPELDPERVAYFSRNCSGMHTDRLIATIQRALDGGPFIERPFRPGQVPVHPGYGVMMERMFHPLQVEMALAEHGIMARQITHDERSCAIAEQERGRSGTFVIAGERLPDTLDARIELARQRHTLEQ
jgi:SAM-dependent methyltransferase